MDILNSPWLAPLVCVLLLVVAIGLVIASTGYGSQKPSNRKNSARRGSTPPVKPVLREQPARRQKFDPVVLDTILDLDAPKPTTVPVADRDAEAYRKGAEGEAVVRGVIERAGLDAFHDVYFPTKHGATQIDHVVRCGTAIVSIETKHWSGAVTGRRNHPFWKQVIQGSGETYDLINPLEQNAVHVRALRQRLGGDVRGFVVVTGRATFPDGKLPGVLLAPELEDKLHSLKRATSRPGRDERAVWRRLEHILATEDIEKLRTLHQKSVEYAKSVGEVLNSRQPGQSLAQIGSTIH